MCFCPQKPSVNTKLSGSSSSLSKSTFFDTRGGKKSGRDQTGSTDSSGGGPALGTGSTEKVKLYSMVATVKPPNNGLLGTRFKMYRKNHHCVLEIVLC